MRSCSGFPDLRSGSIVVCHYAMGLSFLALILLGGRLYEVDREVNFLHIILATWLPPDVSGSPQVASGNAPATQTKAPPKATQPPPVRSASLVQRYPKSAQGQNHINFLKLDVKSFLYELSSARMTLILSVVFVGIFILSWWWMAFAIKQAKGDGGVSLRTVLLLAVFAAVDVAASSGFILLRIIMYIRKDHYFPRELRTPSSAAEHDQIAAYAALRLITLQSSCGSTDIFVIVVVGFLTGLRVYSVICVFSYYRKVKNETVDTYQQNVVGSSDSSSRADRLKPEEYIPRPVVGSAYPKRHGTYMSRERSRFSSITATASTTYEDEIQEIKIQAADMPLEMQRAALCSAAQAVKLFNTEKHIAESIKQDFDQMFHPTWHCIVGRNWGSCVTHSKQCYIRLAYKDLTILLYRST